jgi:protein-L-isoaspartate(D-aspartate) O-methyltransferase
LSTRTTTSLTASYSIAEFFVMKRYRRQGLGREFAVQVLNTLRGISLLLIFGSDRWASTAGLARYQQAYRRTRVTPLQEIRRRFAEELRYKADVKSGPVLRAFATVPRELFLGDGPWRLLNQFSAEYWGTEDANPAHLYHDVLVALDEDRRLNNGQPSLWAFLFDSLAVKQGEHAVHIGCGTGYYSAILAETVGAGGRVAALDYDSQLAETARQNLHERKNVAVIHGNGCQYDAGTVDVIVVNAGATHPVPLWLNSLAPQGRLLLALTGDSHSGGYLRIKRVDQTMDSIFEVKPLCGVSIFPCEGARDPEIARQLTEAFRKETWRSIRSLRRDSHDRNDNCWLHGDDFCWSKKEATVC